MTCDHAERAQWIAHQFCPLDAASEMVAIWTVAELETAIFYVAIPFVIGAWVLKRVGIRHALTTAKGRAVVAMWLFVLFCGTGHVFRGLEPMIGPGIYLAWLMLITVAYVLMGLATALFAAVLRRHAADVERAGEAWFGIDKTGAWFPSEDEQ